MMQVFFTPDIKGITYTLSKEESKHCTKVLRMKMGDEVCMIDGKGGLYYGIIDDTEANNCIIRIIEKVEQYGRKNYTIHIAIAPTKNIARFEWFLEKATELGIDKITPLLCARSERKVIKLDRLDKIVLSAMKQSIKAYRPVLNPLTPYKEFIQKNNSSAGFIAHCEDKPKPSLKSQLEGKQNFVVLIGPEGDFTPEEIDFALANNFQEVHMGKTRLRTETAGIVACHTLNIIKDE